MQVRSSVWRWLPSRTGCLWRRFKNEPVAFRVVAKYFRVPPPIQSRIDLPLDVFLGEVLVQNVVEEFKRKRAI